MAELNRIVRLRLPTVLGVVAMIGCVAIEHTRGIYAPSEHTGAGGNVCGLIVIVTTLGMLAWNAARTRRAAIWKTSAGSVLLLALVGAVSEALYFELVLGGLSEQMEAFTRTTLGARGVPSADLDVFTESVRASWAWTRTLPNTFALYLVWGGLLGGGVVAVVRGVTHVRSSGAE